MYTLLNGKESPKIGECLTCVLFVFGGGGGGEVGSVGRLTGVDISATGFAHCLACWPPELTSPYRK